MDLLMLLAMELWTTDPQRAQELTREGVSDAVDLDYPKGIAWGQLNTGIQEWQSGNPEGFGRILESLNWFTENEERHGEAYARAFLGLHYWSFGDFESGFDMVFRTLEIGQVNGIPDDGVGWAHQMLAGFYYDSGDMEQALHHYQECRRIFEGCENGLGLSRALNGIGNILIARDQLAEALEYQEKGLALARALQHGMSESRVLNDLGHLYAKMGDPDKGLDFHLQSLKIRTDLNYSPGKTTTLMDIGDLLLKQGEVDKAEQYFQEALALSESINARPKVVRALGGLVKILQARQEYEKVLELLKRRYQLEKEIFHQDSRQKLQNLKTVYQAETSSKEAEIHRLRNVELKEKNEKLTQTLNQLHSAQAQLIQSGKMAALGNLVAGVLHEINSPLGVLKSNLDLLARVSERLDKTLNSLSLPETLELPLQKILNTIRENQRGSSIPLERIESILQSLRSFVRLDAAALNRCNLHEELDNVLVLLSHQLKEGPTIVRHYAPDFPELLVNVSEVNQVFMNLLINAIEATPPEGQIEIRTEVFGESVKVWIR
ncbi:MAG TPA: tetratricopeptide repeat protein, partial [Calditrichia bacterium]|nr:tetratricopeptide repeat protein [Calditrichia bacterium]